MVVKDIWKLGVNICLGVSISKKRLVSVIECKVRLCCLNRIFRNIRVIIMKDCWVVIEVLDKIR